MRPRSAKTAGETLETLDEYLAALTSAGSVEVREGGRRMPELEGFRFEVRRHGGRTLLHLWSSERSLVRRVMRLVERSPERVVLEVERFGRVNAVQLEMALAGAPLPEGRLSRERFRARFAEILAEQFPDERVQLLTMAPDLEHSFSRLYVRGVQAGVKQRQTRRAVLAVSAAEGAGTVDEALTFGLLWLDWQREQSSVKQFAGLRLFMPAGAATETALRMRGLSPDAQIELYELEEAGRLVRRVEVRDTGNRAIWLAHRRDSEQALEAAMPAVERVRQLAPEAIDRVVPPGSREVVLRFRGLEFARWKDERMEYTEAGALGGQSFKTVEDCVERLQLCRNPQAKDRNHPLFRVQPERWLEASVLADPRRVDARLDPHHLYRQVPAMEIADRGVIDLLGVTRDGRLVVIELKASEDIHLPLQGLSYWLRVREHQKEGTLQRYGYFTGVELQAAAPLLFLVAPGFRFHSAGEILLRYFLPEISVTRIGLNENWRSELQVVFRQ